ncbi:LxmA leader domain family RiPP [Actinomycetes bacterium M1A6_2h]
MNEKLIEGYLSYTTAEEYGATAIGDAPATPVIVTVTIAAGSAAGGVSVSETVQHGC